MIQWTTEELQRVGNKPFDIAEENIQKFRYEINRLHTEQHPGSSFGELMVLFSTQVPNIAEVSFKGESTGCYVVETKKFLCPVEGMFSPLFNPKIEFQGGARMEEFIKSSK